VIAPMVVTGPELVDREDLATVSMFVHTGGEEKEIWYRLPAGSVVQSKDALLAATLLPAMREGRSLQIGAAISPRLLGNVPTIQNIFRSWDSRFREIAIDVAPSRVASSTAGRGVGCFFTGGMDSFYTALKHKEEITHLVFIHGFDVRMDDISLRANVSQSLREAAARLEKPLLEVHTNVREFSDRYAHWELYHGAALATVGLLLSSRLHKMFIAASRSYTDLVPLGSHPLLDPLWSTETIEFVHDGCEATRVEKASAIASDDAALQYLRVCWENRGGAYNCGECEKCLRTMISLRTIGALQKCPAFKSPLDLKALARLRVAELHRAHFENNLRVLESSGSDPELADALRRCLRNQRRKDLARHALQRLKSRLN
jgi:hypothetical protein